MPYRNWIGAGSAGGWMDATVIRDASFPEVDREGWLKLAERALAGASFEDKLVSRTDDGIRVEPLYPRVTNPNLLPRAEAAARWAIVQRIDDPDARRAREQALEDVANGATGLALVFAGAPNAFGFGLRPEPDTLAQVLDGVQLTRTHVRIDVHPGSRSTINWMADLLAAKRVDPARLSLSFGIDPAAYFASAGKLRMSLEALQASMPQSLAHFFALGVPGILLEGDGRAYHNAGATEAQELGALTATAVFYLRMFEEARQPLVYAAPHIGFAVAVDQDQFVSMAKIRAVRKLWARLQEACGMEPTPARIHAETSYRMTTAKDPETNILRGTIAAFAAAAGGADTISVLPHTIAVGLPDGFARRVARNTQLILADESHLDFISDPASGAGGVEALTDALCEAAWTEFRRIEAEGGIMASVAAGGLQTRIREACQARAERFRKGERTIVGTTLYPAAAERTVSTLAAEPVVIEEEGVAFCEKLPVLRIDETMGAIR
jgi:methylmalonyl-CoA mutase